MNLHPLRSPLSMQLPSHCCVSDQTPGPITSTSWLPRFWHGPHPKGLISSLFPRSTETLLTSLARPKQVPSLLTIHTISRLLLPMELFLHMAACTRFQKLRLRHSESFSMSTSPQASFARLSHLMARLCCLSRKGMAPSDFAWTSEASTRSLRRIGIRFR